MTPGEEAVYKYILELSAHYSNLIIQFDITRTVLNMYAKKELKRLEGLETKLKKMVFDEVDSPLLQRYGYGSILGDALNNIHNGMMCEGRGASGYNTVDPLNGKGVTLTYDSFASELGLSKDVAKNCIERLIEREKISRKRGMGGFEYLANPVDIAKEIIDNPGEWKPHYYNTEIWDYEEDKKLWPIINEAQKDLEPIQDYYERQIKIKYESLIDFQKSEE